MYIRSGTTRLLALLASAALISVSTLRADVVETKGGSRIQGKILASDGGDVVVETGFAGTITVKKDFVLSITTDDSVYVATTDGNTARGKVTATASGLEVATSGGVVQTQPANIANIWREGDKSPADKAADALRRKWTYRLGVDLNGRQGNKDRFFLGISGSAELKGPDDTLLFYANWAQADEEGETTQDDGKFGVDYSNLFSPRVSWYVRTELGYDTIKDLDMRSQTAAGFGFLAIKKEKQRLEFRGGVNYRYDAYGSAEDFDSAGLDLSMIHAYSFPFGDLRNVITYTPAFSDFGNFVLTHTSTLDMPFAGKRDIRLRFGISNEYTSEPPASTSEKHDWSYFSSIVFTWK